MKPFVFRTYVAFVLFLSVGFRALIPPSPGYGATHDDELMVNLTHQLLLGNWLGSYESLGHLTHSKPPGYPLFLAISHVFPWAPTITTHLILLLGILVIAREFRLLGISRPLTLAFVAFSSFAPYWYWDQMSRIYRDGFLAALTFLIIGLTLVARRLILQISNEHQTRDRINLGLIVLSIGGAIGWYYITKPSWHAILFFVLIITGLSVLQISGISKKRKLVLLPSLVVLLIAPTLAVTNYVENKNYEIYGVREIDTFAHGEFPRAMKLMYGIEDKQDRKYVDINLAMRDEMYEISPTARKLQPYLELPDGTGWRGQPCATDLKICDESAAWFPWDLRDAAQAASPSESAIDFEETFRLIADDIEIACHQEKIKCEAGGIAPGLDSIDSISKRDFVEALSLSFLILAKMDSGDFTRGDNSGVDKDRIQLWGDSINGLPSINAPETYERNNAVMGDTRRLLSVPYEFGWIVLLLVSLFGLIVNTGSGQQSKASSTLRVVGITSVLSFGMLSSQLSLLEATSGMYMKFGGAVYLLSAAPFQIMWISAGMVRLVTWMRQVLSGLTQHVSR